jgi:hypothetical protein
MLLHGANPVFIQGKISSVLPARARAATQKNCNSMNEMASSHCLSQGLGPRSLRFDCGRHLRIDEMGFPVKLHRSNREARMSALGQQQTLAHVRVMSALPPKADMELSRVMSALCQKQTSVSERRGVSG